MVYYDGDFYVKIGDIRGDVIDPACFSGWILASVLGWPGVDFNRGIATGDFFLKKIENADVFFKCKLGSHTGHITQQNLRGTFGLPAEIRFLRGFIPVRIILEKVLVSGHRLQGGNEEITLNVMKGTAFP